MENRRRQIDRYLDGNLDASEIKELFAWLAESPQNAEVFARQSLLDQHLTELIEGFVEPLEATETEGNTTATPHAQIPSSPSTQGRVRTTPIGPDPSVNERILHHAKAALEKSKKPEVIQINIRTWHRFQCLVWAGGLAAAFLIIFSLVITLIRSKEVADLKYELELARHDAATAGTEESAVINFYVREHQDIVARHTSQSPVQPEPMQMRVSRDDVLYYELLDDQPEYMHPGIIVRGPSHRGQLKTSQTPAISNGHTLTLSEAQKASDFDLVSPSWLPPCYRLDQIRIIEGRDALQLLYTNGINSISLFEQSLDGRRGLSHHDFREYAVYNNTEQKGVTILAWRDNTLSYVLIGNAELSQLMDIAQSIKATK